ncbi:transferrin-binding protein-like solute binding protein [Neisseria leonii]|uniref:transferrin-binding protein-like solute binding protein n=1 Tax=Neisseria leonii TaxID=2995413 RepID=UPI0030CDEFD8
MANPSMYAKGLTACLSLLLAACAGGGGVEPPKTIPTAQLLAAPQFKVGGKIVDSYGNEGTITELNEKSDLPITMSSDSQGRLKAYSVVRRYWREVSWDPSRSGYVTEPMWGSVFAYTTPEGKIYRLEALSNPQINTGFGITKTQSPTRHEMLPLEDNGGKLITCCENGSSRFAPGYLTDSRFGAWMAPNGQVQFFNGGVLADEAQLPGAAQNGGVPKGKVTYEVIGIRIKNGMAMTSAHDTAKKDNSLLTVNFNTGKLGGRILGNSDFGGDIDFNDVSVSGNAFSGTAVSEGKTGQVSGHFFGKPGYRKPAGSEIGGQVDFSNGNLNAVFGGSSVRHNAADTSRDLNHLNR